MATIETSDFSGAFDNDFNRDTPMMARRLSETIHDLANRYRGQFEEIDRNIGSYRSKILDVFEAMIASLVFDGRQRLDSVLSDAVVATIVVVASEIRDDRFGSRGADDFISDEMRNNGILRRLQDEQNRRNDNRRDNGRRDDYRRNDNRRYNDNRYNSRENGAGRYDNRNNSGKSQDIGSVSRRNNNNSNQRPVNNSNPWSVNNGNDTKPVEKEVVNSTIRDGEVITNENIGKLKEAQLAPVYVIGYEQTIYKDGQLVNIEFTGNSEVDYTKHSIDRFYPDVLGKEKSAAAVAADALAAVNRTRDTVINGFIKSAPVEGEEQTLVPDPKMFNVIKDATYKGELTQCSTIFSPLDVRNQLLELHRGDITWFTKYSLKTKVKHLYPLLNCSNDAKAKIEELLAHKQVRGIVTSLLQLYPIVEPGAWKFLHDLVTERFNKCLIRNDMLFSLESITSNWNELTTIIANEYKHLASVIDAAADIFNGVSIVTVNNGEEDELFIESELTVIFVPASSSDLDLGSASIDTDYAVIKPGSITFDAVNGHMVDTDDGESILLVTNDNKTIEVTNSSTIIKPDQYLVRRYK